MGKTYLTAATHWHVPGVRQYASTERVHAERKAVELVNGLRVQFAADFAEDIAATRGTLHVPPPVMGEDWEPTLRALQLARLIQYYGGEGEANDALFEFAERKCLGEPPLIGEGFPLELQEIIGEFVAEEDRDPDGFGFPMVWIEEVDPAADEGEETYVVVYDTGDQDEPNEEYYGYFASADEAERMYRDVARGKPDYRNAIVCRVVRRLSDD